MDTGEKIFLERTKILLDEEAGRLDPVVANRLRAARLAAIRQERLGARPFPFMTFRLLPAGALAALVLIAFSFFLSGHPEDRTARQDMFEDFEIMTTSEPMDLYEELEFYEWLATHEEAALG